MGYGTGAIMAVPGQDERDWEFAEVFDLPIVRTVQPPDGCEGKAYVGDGPAINSGFLDGLGVADAKRKIIDWLERERITARARSPTSCATGCSAGSGTGASRSRSCTTRRPADRACPSRCCRCCCPRSTTSVPARSRTTTRHRCPSRRWRARTRLGRSRARPRRRPARRTGARRTRCRSGRARAGTSCATSIPTNENAFVDPDVERYWMGPQRPGDPGGVDLYVGGVEHAVLHLLYARFWHKVLFDLGHTSSVRAVPAPVQPGLHPRGGLPGPRGMYVEAAAVEERDGHYYLGGVEVQARDGQDGQEPEERHLARRLLPRVRRRHAAPVRDVHGPARPRAPVGDARRSSASTACCSGCGGW